jgi:hypothetical protein
MGGNPNIEPAPTPIARYLALCIDSDDVGAGRRFWAQALGLQIRDTDGNVSLVGDRAEETVWVNEVAEPKTVKNRVHVDLFARSLAELEVLGARQLQTYERWTVMSAPPDGQEFCAFVRDKVPVRRLKDIVVDSEDPESIAVWWAGVLGGELGSDPNNPWWWVDKVPGAPFESIDFVEVPEPKATKNRVHWDVGVDDVGQLIDAGARVLRPRGGGIAWHVLQDPDGNEFCAFDT